MLSPQETYHLNFSVGPWLPADGFMLNPVSDVGCTGAGIVGNAKIKQNFYFQSSYRLIGDDKTQLIKIRALHNM